MRRCVNVNADIPTAITLKKQEQAGGEDVGTLDPSCQCDAAWPLWMVWRRLKLSHGPATPRGSCAGSHAHAHSCVAHDSSRCQHGDIAQGTVAQPGLGRQSRHLPPHGGAFVKQAGHRRTNAVRPYVRDLEDAKAQRQREPWAGPGKAAMIPPAPRSAC